MSGKRDNTAKLDALLASVTEDILGGEALAEFQEHGLRVERILLELVRPDPIQPRRVLPERIYHAFHDNRLTPTQTMRELVQMAQLAARQKGRPFDGLLDLLPNPDDEGDDEHKSPLSPEENLLRDLVNLATTIRDDGQVNPLTVVDVSQGVMRQFRIETGERRYWATWLLRDFIPGYNGDGMIPCIVIPAESYSPFRQAKENTARTGLSAIAMARQAALLLLAVHGYELPASSVTNDFYRQALDLHLRGKPEYAAEVLTAMGGISKMHFSRYKALLQLSDESLELADRHNVDEFRLRPVLKLPQEHHAEMVRQIVDLGLTGRQIREICEQGILEEDIEKDISPKSRQTVRLAKLMKSFDHDQPDDLARVLVDEEKDVQLARAKLQRMMRYLQQADQVLSRLND
jgi:hypothetical protein